MGTDLPSPQLFLQRRYLLGTVRYGRPGHARVLACLQACFFFTCWWARLPLRKVRRSFRQCVGAGCSLLVPCMAAVRAGGLGFDPFRTGAFYGLFGLFGILYQVEPQASFRVLLLVCCVRMSKP